MSSTSSPTFSDRLARRRPLFERILFGLALFGVLVVVHLHIQQGRGFDRGCLGFSSPQAVEATFNCSAVVESTSGAFLGVSNTLWGLGFYLSIVVLTLFSVAAPARHRTVQAVRSMVLTGGLLYSAYLVYVQFGILGELCALCLTSAGVATALCATQAAALGSTAPSETPAPSAAPEASSSNSMTASRLKRELALFSTGIALLAVLVGADLSYFASLDGPRVAASPTESAPTSAASTASDGVPDATPQACRLATDKERVDVGALLAMQDPTAGSSDAPVTVVEYFDPNCPHCATFYNTMKTVKETHGDDLFVVYKPFPLRGSSLPEIQALYIAAQEGKFQAMLEAQFARQSAGGISERDLRTIADEIGMNADAMMAKIDNDQYREFVVAQRQRAIDLGVNSTPAVIVNGYFVESRSADCMKQFIEQAKSGTLGFAEG